MWAIESVPPRSRGLLAGIVDLFGPLGYVTATYEKIGFFYFKTTEALQ